MRVDLQNYEICYPKRLKKFFNRDINFKTYDEFIPYTERAVVGNIPPEIINLFGKDKPQKIKEFQNALSNLAINLRKIFKDSREQNLIFHDFNELGENLPLFEEIISKDCNDLFRGILPKGTKIKLKYTGRGAWGNVFQFSMTDKKNKKIMHDKAFKVYHRIECPYDNIKDFQNNYAEANFWTFIKRAVGHKLDKTQFTRHYISDMKNGYCMTEFIDNDIVQTTSVIYYEDMLGLEYIDYRNFPINNKLYDAGGFKKRPNFIDDKVVLRYFKKMFNRNSEEEMNNVLANLQQLVKNPKTPHRSKIQKAIELFQNDEYYVY